MSFFTDKCLAGLQLAIGNTSGIMAPFVRTCNAATDFRLTIVKAISIYGRTTIYPRTCCNDVFARLELRDIHGYVLLVHAREQKAGERAQRYNNRRKDRGRGPGSR